MEKNLKWDWVKPEPEEGSPPKKQESNVYSEEFVTNVYKNDIDYLLEASKNTDFPIRLEKNAVDYHGNLLPDRLAVYRKDHNKSRDDLFKEFYRLKYPDQPITREEFKNDLEINEQESYEDQYYNDLDNYDDLMDDEDLLENITRDEVDIVKEAASQVNYPIRIEDTAVDIKGKRVPNLLAVRRDGHNIPKNVFFDKLQELKENGNFTFQHLKDLYSSNQEDYKSPDGFIGNVSLPLQAAITDAAQELGVEIIFGKPWFSGRKASLDERKTFKGVYALHETKVTIYDLYAKANQMTKSVLDSKMVIPTNFFSEIEEKIAKQHLGEDIEYFQKGIAAGLKVPFASLKPEISKETILNSAFQHTRLDGIEFPKDFIKQFEKAISESKINQPPHGLSPTNDKTKLKQIPESKTSIHNSPKKREPEKITQLGQRKVKFKKK